ncbi:MAG: preprotein translocase subunit SecE [Eubacteriales bacterium]|nr:preprotein translocase subunit SecE [Eubacteriales bacterium]
MAEAKKKNIFSRIVSFFRACIGEIKKISWPTMSATTKNFGIVVLVIVVATLLIFALDMGLFKLLSLFMETGTTVLDTAGELATEVAP